MAANQYKYVGTEYPEKTGDMMTIRELGLMSNVNRKTIANRHRCAGRPDEIGDDLLVPPHSIKSINNRGIDDSRLTAREREILAKIPDAGSWERENLNPTVVPNFGKTDYC